MALVILAHFLNLNGHRFILLLVNVKFIHLLGNVEHCILYLLIDFLFHVGELCLGFHSVRLEEAKLLVDFIEASIRIFCLI